jgi:hypothetical protein
VTPDRSRGVALYAIVAVVLTAGAAWYVAADPGAGADERVAEWRATAERIVPDLPRQAVADTMVLTGSATRERTTPVDGGSYTLTMVCAGTGRVRVRLSSFGNDSGRALRCADAPQSEQLTVALADEFFLLVSSEPADPAGAVFRWRLDRAGDL